MASSAIRQPLGEAVLPWTAEVDGNAAATGVSGAGVDPAVTAAVRGAGLAAALAADDCTAAPAAGMDVGGLVAEVVVEAAVDPLEVNV